MPRGAQTLRGGRPDWLIPTYIGSGGAFLIGGATITFTSIAGLLGLTVGFVMVVIGARS